MDRFQQLIWDLGEELDEPIQVENNKTCNLVIDEIFPVQIELDSTEENIIICAFVTEIPPGKFREDALKSALLVNGTYQEFTLGYIEQINMLTLFCKLPFEETRIEAFIDNFAFIIEATKNWKNALNKGSSAPDEYISSPISTKNLPPGTLI